MFFLYSLIYFAVIIFIFPFEYFKRDPNIRRRWLLEKFGLNKLLYKSNTVWLHAVSVGEVNASVNFVKSFLERNPKTRFIISTVTDTGQGVARQRLGSIADVVYIPHDLRFILRPLIKRLKPSIFICIETELWPNILLTMKKEGARVVVLNGRISEKSFNGYMKIRFFLRMIFENVDMFLMQDIISSDRIIALGASADKVKNNGNFKFDIKPGTHSPDLAGRLKGMTIVAGSTHKGEDEIFMDSFIELKKLHKDLNLIIAPRHPERFAVVHAMMRSKGLNPIRKSKLDEAVEIPAGACILLDTVGELFSVYSVCDIAIMGGSFIPHGGQNPLEPAFWEKAIVTGPHMHNFTFIDEFYSEGAAVTTDSDGLTNALDGLINDEEKRRRMGLSAKSMCAKNAGAVDRAVEVLGNLV